MKVGRKSEGDFKPIDAGSRKIAGMGNYGPGIGHWGEKEKVLQKRVWGRGSEGKSKCRWGNQ